jgi:ribonuclease D
LFQPTISKEAIAALPPIEFGGEIVVVDRSEGIDRACDELLKESLLGFDTESRPAFQRGVVNRIALLQLSTTAKCYLFRLNKIRLDKAILKILETPRITKVGLSVAGDIRELETLRRFRPKGFVDLQTLAPAHGIGELSLLKIAAIVLGGRLSKAQRLSNWEAATLTDKQIVYAATDAWACLAIHNRLNTHSSSRLPSES